MGIFYIAKYEGKQKFDYSIYVVMQYLGPSPRV